MLWTLCLAMLLVTSELFCRPLLPPDETRYLSVAWEAHVRGDYLVSHLNSETYAHKPPLLFWLINVVWSLTGPNEYAARLVSPAAGILCILLTSVMARRLWPGSIKLHRCAPMMLASMSLWIVFSPVTMFDTLLTCFVQLALLGVLRAEAGETISGWLIAGVALGLGILAKGPVVLVHVLPATLIAPWWSIRVRTKYARWYLGCGVAILIATTIALGWALPSAAAGGSAYGEELLFGQTTGRMVNSFSHRQPIWWYMPWLPLCLMPWISLGTVWRGMRLTKLDSPLRFLFCWVGASLLILSLVSGKQIYYLLPLIPAMALILSRLATAGDIPVNRTDLSLVVAGTIGMGLLPIVANHLPLFSETELEGLISDGYTLPLVLCGAGLLFRKFHRTETMVFAVGTAAIVFFCVVILSLRPTIWRGFDLRPLATLASRRPDDFAWYGSYQGQLNYLGRFRYIKELPDPDSLAEWLMSHPRGMLFFRPSKASIAAMKRCRMDLTSGQKPSSIMLQKFSEILKNDPDVPCREWQPAVTDVYWVRRGLPLSPLVVLRFEKPQVL